MKLIGVDIDETLCGKEVERFYGVVDQLRQEIVDGSECVLVTSRALPAEGQMMVWDQWGINLPCIATTRDWPELKAEYLIEYAVHLGIAGCAIELWDDEAWYLDPAAQYGIITRRFYKGALIEHVCQPGYKPGLPTTPKPSFILLPRLT